MSSDKNIAGRLGGRSQNLFGACLNMKMAVTFVR